MTRIETPAQGYSGSVAGVMFDDGVADTDDARALAYFRRHGYVVGGQSTRDELVAEPILRELSGQVSTGEANVSAGALSSEVTPTLVVRESDEVAPPRAIPPDEANAATMDAPDELDDDTRSKAELLAEARERGVEVDGRSSRQKIAEALREAE